MFGCDSISILVVAATLVSSVAGQFENWPSGQINTTLCTWSQPRAALLGDTVFLDGGTITWVAGLDTGEYGKMGVGNGRLPIFNLESTSVANVLQETLEVRY
jgi:hypothetical protein